MADQQHITELVNQGNKETWQENNLTSSQYEEQETDRHNGDIKSHFQKLGLYSKDKMLSIKGTTRVRFDRIGQNPLPSFITDSSQHSAPILASDHFV